MFRFVCCLAILSLSSSQTVTIKSAVSDTSNVTVQFSPGFFQCNGSIRAESFFTFNRAGRVLELSSVDHLNPASLMDCFFLFSASSSVTILKSLIFNSTVLNPNRRTSLIAFQSSSSELKVQNCTFSNNNAPLRNVFFLFSVLFLIDPKAPLSSSSYFSDIAYVGKSLQVDDSFFINSTCAIVITNSIKPISIRNSTFLRIQSYGIDAKGNISIEISDSFFRNGIYGVAGLDTVDKYLESRRNRFEELEVAIVIPYGIMDISDCNFFTNATALMLSGEIYSMRNRVDFYDLGMMLYYYGDIFSTNDHFSTRNTELVAVGALLPGLETLSGAPDSSITIDGGYFNGTTAFITVTSVNSVVNNSVLFCKFCIGFESNNPDSTHLIDNCTFSYHDNENELLLGQSVYSGGPFGSIAISNCRFFKTNILISDYFSTFSCVNSLFIGTGIELDGAAIQFDNPQVSFPIPIDQVGRVELDNIQIPDPRIALDRGGAFSFKGYFSSISIKNSYTKSSQSVGTGGFLSVRSTNTNILLKNLTIIEALSNLGAAFELIVTQDERLSGGSIVIEDVNIYNCTNLYEGSIFIDAEDIPVSIVNSRFYANAGASGAAISIEAASLVNISGCSFEENYAYRGSCIQSFGGRVGTMRITDSTFIGNIATTTAAVRLYEGPSVFEGMNLSFYNNTAKSYGGAISIEGTSTKFVMENSSFRNCSSKLGGAISMIEVEGFSPSSIPSVTLSNVEFDSNHASEEGGSMYVNLKSRLSLNITRSKFTNNSADDNGGALYYLSASNSKRSWGYRAPTVGSQVSINSNTFDKNNATKGGALYLQNEEDFEFQVSGSTFTQNGASLGSSLYSQGATTLDGSTIQNGSPGSASVAVAGGYLSMGTTNSDSRDSVSVSGSGSLIDRGENSGLGAECGANYRLDSSNSTSRCIYDPVLTSNPPDIIINVIQPTNSKNTIIGLAVGIGGGGLLLILLLAIFIIYMRRRARLRAEAAKANDFILVDFSEVALGDAEKSLVQFSELTNLSPIGSGAFGVVFRADWRNLKVAVKQIKSDNVTLAQIQDFLGEVAIVSRLRSHPNLVMFLGLTFPPDPLSLITEFCERGGLYEYLRENLISMDDKMRFIKGITLGMIHLHAEKIIHRDLACRNILLSRHLQPKVSDFGLSRQTSGEEDASKTQTEVGPLKWMSPEAIQKREYSTKSDVFSFGVVVWEILYIKDPYPSLTPVEAALSVVKGMRLPIEEDSPEMLRNLMNWCWEESPSARPEFSQINAMLDGRSVRLEEKKKRPISQFPSVEVEDVKEDKEENTVPNTGNYASLPSNPLREELTVEEDPNETVGTNYTAFGSKKDDNPSPSFYAPFPNSRN